MRDNGNPVRRNVTRKNTFNNPDVSVYDTGGFVFIGEDTGAAKSTKVVTTRERIWFEGQFRYFIPMADDIASKWERWNLLGRRMAGLSVSSLPETVWAIAPWTWLGDWFADFSSFFQNVDYLGGDGLLLDRGYLMRHIRVEHRLDQVTTATYQGLKRSASYGYVAERKTRIRASPWGFGLTFDGLSTRQQSILAALGVTRGKRY